MKFKYPKKVRIGAYTYKVIYDKKSGGGSFDYPYRGKPARLTIGMRDVKGDSGDFFAILIHEVIEILHVDLCNRYAESGTSNDYVFMYRHDKHTAVCCMLAGILKEFIK